MKTKWFYETAGGSEGSIDLSPLLNSQDAAKEIWEYLCHQWAEYHNGTITVWREGHEREQFEVTIEAVPEFHAHKVETPNAQ